MAAIDRKIIRTLATALLSGAAVLAFPCAVFTPALAQELPAQKPDAKLLLQRAGERTWSEVAVPEDAPSAFDQWVGHIQQGTTATANIQAALDLTKLMEAANRSAARGAKIQIADLKS